MKLVMLMSLFEELCSSDVEVGFDAADYTVVEGEGIVMVCANMTGLVDTAVTVSFNTAVDATAARAIAESGTGERIELTMSLPLRGRQHKQTNKQQQGSCM